MNLDSVADTRPAAVLVCIAELKEAFLLDGLAVFADKDLSRMLEGEGVDCVADLCWQVKESDTRYHGWSVSDSRMRISVAVDDESCRVCLTRRGRRC